MKKVLCSIYVLSVIWWISIFIRGIHDVAETYLFNIPISLIPIISALYFFLQQGNYKLFKSAYFWVSIGLVLWGIGTLVFITLDSIDSHTLPYPSLADLFYLPAFFSWIISVIILNLFDQKNRYFFHFLRTVFSLVFTCVSLVGLLFVLRPEIYLHWNIVVFFRIVYPIVDIIFFLALGIFIFHSFCKKRMLSIAHRFLITGLACNYLADLFFSLTTDQNTFFSGSWVDLFFLTAMFFISFSVILFTEEKKYEKSIS